VKGDPASAVVNEGTLILKNRAVMGHPSILSGDEVVFTFHTPDSYGALAVELFKDDVTSTKKAGTLHMMRSGNQFWCAVERADGQSRSSDYVGNVKAGPVAIKLIIQDGLVEVWANGMPLVNAALPNADRRGQALTFGASEMWGGGQVTTLHVSNFQVVGRPDHLPMPSVDEKSKEMALTLPRFMRDSPPQQVLLAPNGDVLRGRLDAVEGDNLKFTAGVETVNLPLKRVQSAIWLQPPASSTPATVQAKSAGESVGQTFNLVLRDGGRFSLRVDKFGASSLHGTNDALGDCTVPYEVISTLRNTTPPPSAALAAYSGWQLKPAPEPVLPEDGGQSSPLLGKPAPLFTIQRIGSVPFDLQSEKGRVIVLDFWATWCGPCVVSMPETLKVLSTFDRTQVRFLALNQGEPDAIVRPFIERQGWKMDVALDLQQKVGADYGVEGLPFTVVIGRDGKVAWTRSGVGGAEDGAKLAAAIQKALATPVGP
jgi:thiol-disulfide isomerase/thioredoxin